MWETWDGRQWVEIKPTTETSWTSNVTITVTLPASIAPTAINGETNYWIRARINQWNYGQSTPVVTATTLSELPETTNTKKDTIKVESVRGFMPSDRIQVLGKGDAQESSTIALVDHCQSDHNSGYCPHQVLSSRFWCL